jgi:hypothetical protein
MLLLKKSSGDCGVRDLDLMGELRGLLDLEYVHRLQALRTFGDLKLY